MTEEAQKIDQTNSFVMKILPQVLHYLSIWFCQSLAGWIGANVKLFEGFAFGGENMSGSMDREGETLVVFHELGGFGFLCRRGIFDIESLVEQASGIVDAQGGYLDSGRVQQPLSLRQGAINRSKDDAVSLAVWYELHEGQDLIFGIESDAIKHDQPPFF